MKTRLSPMPWHTHDQPLKITNREARRLPKKLYPCTEYKVFHFMTQKARAKSWDHHELKTGYMQ